MPFKPDSVGQTPTVKPTPGFKLDVSGSFPTTPNTPMGQIEHVTNQQNAISRVQAGKPMFELPGSGMSDVQDSTQRLPGAGGFTQLGKNIGGVVADSEIKFGTTLGEAAATQSKDFKDAQGSMDNLLKAQAQLAKSIHEGKKAGKDVSHADKIYQENADYIAKHADMKDVVPSIAKTPEQIAGEGLGVATDIASMGQYGPAVKGAETGKLLSPAVIKATEAALPKTAEMGLTQAQAFVKGATAQAPIATAIGAAQGASSAMEQNKGVVDVVKQGAEQGIQSGLFASVLGGLAERKKTMAPDIQKQAIEQYKKGIQVTGEKYKEMQADVVPQLLESKTWGTYKGLVKKAESGIALSKAEYQKLGELQGYVQADGIIENIDSSMAKLKNPAGAVISTENAKYNKLAALRDDILGFREQGVALASNGGADAVNVKQQGLRELAQAYGDVVYDSRKAQKTVEESQTLSQVKKVDGMIRSLLAEKNPEYDAINKVYHQSTQLLDVLEKSKRFQKSDFHALREIVSHALPAVTGIGISAGTHNPVATAAGIVGATAWAISDTTWWNTLRAVQKNELAKKLTQMPLQKMSYWMTLMARDGVEVAKRLINEDRELQK